MKSWIIGIAVLSSSVPAQHIWRDRAWQVDECDALLKILMIDVENGNFTRHCYDVGKRRGVLVNLLHDGTMRIKLECRVCRCTFEYSISYALKWKFIDLVFEKSRKLEFIPWNFTCIYLFIINVPRYVGGWMWGSNSAARFEIIICIKSLLLYNHLGLVIWQLDNLHHRRTNVGVKERCIFRHFTLILPRQVSRDSPQRYRCRVWVCELCMQVGEQ